MRSPICVEVNDSDAWVVSIFRLKGVVEPGFMPHFTLGQNLIDSNPLPVSADQFEVTIQNASVEGAVQACPSLLLLIFRQVRNLRPQPFMPNSSGLFPAFGLGAPLQPTQLAVLFRREVGDGHP
ncbi:hypothetical protein D9M71_550490 [compost metagenome]